MFLWLNTIDLMSQKCSIFICRTLEPQPRKKVSLDNLQSSLTSQRTLRWAPTASYTSAVLLRNVASPHLAWPRHKPHSESRFHHTINIIPHTWNKKTSSKSNNGRDTQSIKVILGYNYYGGNSQQANICQMFRCTFFIVISLFPSVFQDNFLS